MSRSQPTLTNPAHHFIEWVGSKGQLSWYNKEKKENIPVRLPFEFMVLDELSTIKGFSKRDNNGYYSNEVRNVTKDQFNVKVAGQTKQEGLYAELADVRAKGAKYTKSIYIAHKVGHQYIIDNFNAGGSALSAWIEFSKTCKPQTGKVTILKENTHVPAANGISEYYIPHFEFSPTTPEEDTEAIKLDKELQIYLSQYLSTPKVDDLQDEHHVEDNLIDEDTVYRNIAESEAKEDPRGWKDGKAKAEDVVIEDIGDDPINLDDIPF